MGKYSTYCTIVLDNLADCGGYYISRFLELIPTATAFSPVTPTRKRVPTPNWSSRVHGAFPVYLGSVNYAVYSALFLQALLKTTALKLLDNSTPHHWRISPSRQRFSTYGPCMAMFFPRILVAMIGIREKRGTPTLPGLAPITI